MKVNPVYHKELKTSVRGMRTAILLFSYNGLLALFGLFAFYVTFEYNSKYGGAVDYSDILRVYSIITALEFGLVLFTVPAFTSSSISGERERQTLEILLTSNLTPFQIILGKLASSISKILLLAFSSLPVLALTFSVGGITFKNLLEFMVLIVVTAVFIGSIGTFFSTLFKKTTMATVSTYGALLLIGIGTLLLLDGITTVKGLYINRFIDPNGIKKLPDTGNLVLVLLVNPIISFFTMIENQIGTGSNLIRFIHNYGVISVRYHDQWFLLSMTIQLVISTFLISCSSHLLNPLRKHRRVRHSKGTKKKDKEFNK